MINIPTIRIENASNPLVPPGLIVTLVDESVYIDNSTPKNVHVSAAIIHEPWTKYGRARMDHRNAVVLVAGQQMVLQTRDPIYIDFDDGIIDTQMLRVV